ncbi:MAG: hypothetical protein LBQ42_11540 [Synergistaceae bacterium]|jgi:hypothetical protein|nr:hypothetical protein [Synergistaceae bacterium]
MTSFRLSGQTVERLRRQFDAFEADREKLHRLKDDYVLDYRSFRGTALERQEYLREKYRDRAPALSHLLFEEGETSPCWGLSDIAVLLGRDGSSVSRTLRKIEKTRGWRPRLYGLRKTSNVHALIPVYVYSEDIFDLIVDFYEEEYLHRFAKPRRGTPPDPERRREIYRYWQHLKQCAERESLTTDQSRLVVEDVPPLTPGEILKLIFHRMLNVRMGAFFIVLFGFFHEGTRQWPALHFWVPVVCACLFCGTVFSIRERKFEPAILADFAAGTLLFAALWGAATLSLEGTPKSLRGFPGSARQETRQETTAGNKRLFGAKTLQFYNPYARVVSRGYWIALGDQWREDTAMEVHAMGVPEMEGRTSRPEVFAITELKVTDDLSSGFMTAAARDVLEWNGTTISMMGNKIGFTGRPKEGGRKTFRVFAETEAGWAIGDFTLHILAHSVGLAPRMISGSVGTAWHETVSVFVAEEPDRGVMRVTLSNGERDNVVSLDLDGLVVAVDSSEQYKKQLVIRGTPRKPGERGITVKARSTMGFMTSATLSIDIR